MKDDTDLSYDPVDLGENDNGQAVLRICKDQKLLVVNNLKTRNRFFRRDLTYKEKKRWISEVDVCLVSKSLVPNIIGFNIDKSANLPSDHAPVSVNLYIPEQSMDMKQLLEKSSDLGGYDIPDSKKDLCRKGTPYKNIDKEKFTTKLETAAVPQLNDYVTVNEAAENFTDFLYSCVADSVKSVIIIMLLLLPTMNFCHDGNASSNVVMIAFYGRQ